MGEKQRVPKNASEPDRQQKSEREHVGTSTLKAHGVWRGRGEVVSL